MSELSVNEQSVKEARIELQYLPCLEYFVCILQYDHVWIDVDERYVKQTFRNRCDVLTTNKIDSLTVPVKAFNHCLTRDVKIDNSQDWVRRHLGCLKAAYGKSPYYEYYAPEFMDVYRKNYEFLIDLNYDLLTICLRLVGAKGRATYNLSGTEIALENVINEISQINNKKSIRGLKRNPGCIESVRVIDLQGTNAVKIIHAATSAAAAAAHVALSAEAAARLVGLVTFAPREAHDRGPRRVGRNAIALLAALGDEYRGCNDSCRGRFLLLAVGLAP